MDSKLLILAVVFCAVVSVSVALDCYDCKAWDLPIVGEKGDDNCMKMVNENSTSKETTENCTACVAESFTKVLVVDYMKRYCWTKPADECVTGETEEPITDIDVLSAATYDVNRKCCTTDLCNMDDFSKAINSALPVSITSSLLTVIVLSLYFNF